MSRLTSRIRSGLPRWTADWLRDSRLLLTFQILATVATSALAIIVARALGPSSWGFFSGLLGLTLALSTLVEFGLGTWLLREISAIRAHTAPHGDYREAAALRIAGALAATGTIGAALITGSIVILALAGVSTDIAVTFVCLLVYTLALTAGTCMEAYFRADRKLKVVGIALGLEKLVLVTGAGGVALLGFGTSAIALGYLAGGALRLIYVATMLFRGERVPLRRPRPQDVRRYFLSGMPFAFNTMALTVIPRVDTFLIAIVSTSAAGFFAIADRVLGPALIIPFVASRALYPFLVRESRMPWHIASGFFVAGALIAGLGAMLAPTLVPIIFGEAYEDAVRVVQLMLMALPFAFASNLFLVRLYSVGRERAVLGVTLVASLVGTAAVVLGQLAAGPVGAAGGYVLRNVLLTAGLTYRIGGASPAQRPSVDPSAESDGPMVWSK